jgi:microcystin-dependent protein
LFSILGTTYGGNGTSTFQLPNMQSRIPYNWGQGPGLSNYTLGQVGGEENHTLLASEMPLHIHLVNAVNAAPNAAGAAGNVWCQNANAYGSPPNGVVPGSDIGFAGGSQPHPNLAPYLVVSFCIALVGTFPSRN